MRTLDGHPIPGTFDGIGRLSAFDPYRDWVPNGAGLLVPPKHKRRFPIAIDLFCGAGGFSCGIIQAGFQVVAAVDNDPVCMMTYLLNLGADPCQIVFIEPDDEQRAEKAIAATWKRDGWVRGKDGHLTRKDGKLVGPYNQGPSVSGGNAHRILPDGMPGVGHFFFGDIRKLDGRRMLDMLDLQPGEVDMVVGSPPCQGFSNGGRRNVYDPRNSLVFDWARLVLEINPKTFVFENVPGITSMVTPEGIPVLDALCRVLADGGFGPLDALKRSLLGTSGVGAAVRKGQGTRRDSTTEDDASEGAADVPERQAQMAMF